MRSPLDVLFQVFREVLGEKNVSGVAAAHDALCHVNSSTGEIGLIVHICEWIDRATVNAHAQFEFRVVLQGLADFERALHGRFGIVGEHQHHSIARR